jgi:hypothetical protein
MPRDERPNEQEAVRTTIVGGRPPGSGKAVGPIPRGIEVLVKKAAVDPAFKQVLLEKRAKAADEISLKLEPAEVAMLTAVPAAQLETIIASSNVTDLTRSAFLGRAAAVMLAALGVSTQGCSSEKGPPTTGIAPDRIPTKGIDPEKPKADPGKDIPPAAAQSPGSRPDPVEPKPPSQEATPPAPTGIRPDQPPPKPGADQPPPKEEPPPPPPPKPDPDQQTRGIRPDVPMTKGIQPDVPVSRGIQPDEILPPGFGADEIKKRVEAMVKLLASPEENTRVEAKQALLGMGPSILPALKDVKAPSVDAEKDLQAIVQALEERLKKK